MRQRLHHRLRPAAAAGLATLLLVGACGDDDDSGAAASTGAASSTVGGEATTGSSGPSTTLDISKVGGDPFCLEIAKQANMLTGGGLDTQADYEAAAKVFEGLAAKAPQAIKGDMSLLATWAATFAPYVGQIDDLSAKAGKGTAAEQEQLAKDLDALRAEIETETSQSDLDTATQNLDAWTEANCTGLDATSGG